MSDSKSLLICFLLLLQQFSAYSNEVDCKIYIDNTDGTEEVWAAVAYHHFVGKLCSKNGWGETVVSGWYQIPAGKKTFLTTIKHLDAITVAFAKDGESRFYAFGKKNEPLLDTLSVEFGEIFEYKGLASARLPNRIFSSFSVNLPSDNRVGTLSIGIGADATDKKHKDMENEFLDLDYYRNHYLAPKFKHGITSNEEAQAYKIRAAAGAIKGLFELMSEGR